MDMLAQRRAVEKGVTPKAMMQTFLASLSLGVAMRPADIAAMMLFLASPARERISGHVFVVDADSL
jgi:NAD(P)-dependent dehydrogenase (short-subunit alcohol dehydrogenase family)